MRRRAAIAAAVAGVVVVAVVAVFATLVARPPAVSVSPLNGEMAPQISGSNLLTGAPVSLASLRDKFVLVSFFASWCTPCATEEPQLEAFAVTEHASASVLGVVFDDSAANAASFLRHYGATWSAVTDPLSKTAVAYGVADPPQSFLVAPGGRIVAWFPGAVTLDSLIHTLAEAKKTDG